MKPEFIRQWLWMEAMNYACDQLFRSNECLAVKGQDKLELTWEELNRKVFGFVLENWDKCIRRVSEYSGTSCGHDRFNLGYDLQQNKSCVTAKYRGTEVTIKWPEVRRFVDRMLNPTLEDRQLDLLGLLEMYSFDGNFEKVAKTQS